MQNQAADIDRLERVGVRIPIDPKSRVEPLEFVPLFHRWIQTSAVEGRLIDVVNYAHLPNGPTVVLITDTGHYVLDRVSGRYGFGCRSKRGGGGTLTDRLAAVVCRVWSAARLIEAAGSLPHPVNFEWNTIEIKADDRLLAPNTGATFHAFRPSLVEALGRMFGSGGASRCTFRRQSDPRTVFGMRITIEGSALGSSQLGDALAAVRRFGAPAVPRS